MTIREELAIVTAYQAAYYEAHPKCGRCLGSGMQNARYRYWPVGNDGTVNPELLSFDDCAGCGGSGMQDGAPRWSRAMLPADAFTKAVPA